MSRDKEEQKRLIESVSNEMLKSKHVQEVGQKAIVQRERLENDSRTQQLREVLQEIGRNADEIGLVPKGFVYKGSMAVHIYEAPTVRMQCYFNQLAVADCPEVLAGLALQDLKGAAMEEFGHRRQKKRSGF